MTKTPKPETRPEPGTEAHTEVKPRDEAAVAAAKKAEAKRAGLDMLPETASDDTLDDLFNDMPV